MAPINKDNVSQEVFDLYDDYAHNRITRKDFVKKLSLYAVGGLTVSSLMSFLMPDYKTAIRINKNDPRLESVYVTYESPNGGGTIKGLLSYPKEATGKLGGIVVVHENRGLNPHIEDVARRAALAGFVSFAPDALTPLGGYPGNDDEGRTLQSQRNRDEMLEDFIAAHSFLSQHEKCNGKAGVVGFCFGGWIANMMATRIPTLAAAVPFYGGTPPMLAVRAIKAPLLIHLGELDTRVNEAYPEYEEALKMNNVSYEIHIYEKGNHGFNNDTTPRYDKALADLAWSRTIEFFKKHLQ